SVDDAGAFAVRFADLGASYISLSAGGKFEDAVHREGEPLYPYTGYSGDRCMPGDRYPDAANIWMADSVRRTLREARYQTPVLGTGKIGSVALANEVLGRGACDIVGMARALLADPYLPTKSQSGRTDEVVSCIYCNVCKSLDENFNTVVCYLWPKGSTQAPPADELARAATQWQQLAPLSGRTRLGEIRLSWETPSGDAAGYDVLRSVDDGDFSRLTSVTRTRLLDDSVVRDQSFRYRVIPYDSAGLRGESSNVVELRLEEPAL
ncbi:MAG: hypothetical protein V3V01_07835, partial [Acidimicrobiales bacterium]